MRVGYWREVVRYQGLREVPLSNYVTQWSRILQENGDQFRKMLVIRINRKIGDGRRGCIDIAERSY